MKNTYVFLIFCLSQIISAKEFKTLAVFQKETGQQFLSEKDWLRSDRRKNTQVWQNANIFNLNNQLPLEYETIAQRRDFYEWYYKIIEVKGHEVVWPKMAHYISTKLKLTKSFPFNVFAKKSVKSYAYQGSETVFIEAFTYLKDLLNSDEIIKHELAVEWDEKIIFEEQFKWLQDIYETIDDETLKTVGRMARGKGFYTFLVPTEIEFIGNIEIKEDRYNYAVAILRPYCKKQYD